MPIYNSLIDKLDECILANYPKRNASTTIEDVLDDEEMKTVVTTANVLVKSCILAREKIVHYYTKTDQSKVFAIGTAMDPRFKFAYWESQNWGVYADHAQKKVKDEWEDNYKSTSYVQSTSSTQQRQHENSGDESDDDAFSAALSKIQKSQPTALGDDDDELKKYIKQGPIIQKNAKKQKNKQRASLTELASTGSSTFIDLDAEDEDAATVDDMYLIVSGNQFEEEQLVSGLSDKSEAITFWMKESGDVVQGGQFPHLSKMAKDYLQVPATSTSVERLFSRSKRVITSARSRLTPDNVKRIMLLSYWCTLEEDLQQQ